MTKSILHVWMLSVAFLGCVGSGSAQRSSKQEAHARDPYKIEAVKSYIDGLINEMAGDLDAASRDFQMAIMLDTSSNTMYASLADNFMLTGQPEKSLPIVQKILSREPNHVAALELLSEIQIQKHEFESALTTLERIVKIDPAHVEVHYRLITIYEIQGKWNEAAAHYTTLLNVLGPNTLLTLKLSDLYMKNKAFDKAANVLSTARSGDPNNVFILEALAQAYEFNKEFPKALSTYETLSDLQDNNPMILLRVGSLSLQSGQYEKSIAAFKKADAITPNIPEVQRSLGFSFSQLKQNDDAIRYFEKAISLNHKDVLSMSLLTPLYQEKKWLDKSDSLFERILTLEPENDIILNNYSYSLAERGINLEKALLMVQKALKIAPGNAHFLDTMGWVYYQMGLYELALKFVLQANQTNAGSWEVADHLGDIHAKLKNYPEAKSFWQKALQLNPENETIKKKLNSTIH
ncbi:tetratricopeptide repeat protein [bacterium]|nr:MAG: tetratricopeptide repeat protein [bacterium]